MFNISQKLSVILWSAAVTLVSCKSRHETTLSRAKHQFGATSVPRSDPFPDCVPQTSDGELLAYGQAIANHLMKSNPSTFTGVYAPDKLCLSVMDDAFRMGFARSDVGVYGFFAGLLFMTEDQKDADLAMVLSRALAQITLQLATREPTADELPNDIDQTELRRRFRLKSIFEDKKLSMKQGIARDAKTDGSFADFVWLVRDLEAVIPGLEKLSKANERNVFEFMRSTAAKINGQFPAIIRDGGGDPSDESEFVLRSARLVTAITSELSKVSAIIAKPILCDDTMPCEDIQKIGRLASYIQARINPVRASITKLKMPEEDDPSQYPPYAQWADQLADEVGFEIYLRAGFKPERYETYMRSVLPGERPGALEACQQALDQREVPSRLQDTHGISKQATCFRIYNISVVERAKYASEHQDLLVKAQTEDLAETSGQLAKLRDQYVARKTLLP